jgi:hypothetical protein
MIFLVPLFRSSTFAPVMHICVGLMTIAAARIPPRLRHEAGSGAPNITGSRAAYR